MAQPPMARLLLIAAGVSFVVATIAVVVYLLTE